ncbi:carbohydrate ABC transporter permease [Massiliimalia massiliensis]|uniref:carbohydrate ABC transporter permease n=1 Tax=Massiliimalia massiliensis TaxID=1852384 RepID=UPI000987A78C|nr:carbohydrate ABC transporter permease [Massiliimalia massiliensis]
MKARSGSSYKSDKVWNIVRILILVAVTILLMLPVYPVILGAFKPEKEMYTNLLGLPHQWVTDNFTTAWVKGNFEKYYVNTLIITVFQVLICTPLSAMLGFALSRKDLYGKKIITLALLAGLTIPAQVAIMPLFLQMKAFNLTNSIPGLIITLVGYRLAFTTFIFQRFMSAVPTEIEEAATIDGCSIPKLFIKIVLPLSQNVLSIGIIFNVMYAWNNFFFPMVLISDRDLKPISTGLLAFKGENTIQYTLLFAAIAICTVPIMILYIFMQKYIVKGITSGAVKG